MRWVSPHDACETLSATLPAVIDVLEDLIKVSGERSATARRMITQLNTRFVVHLCIFKFLPQICADVSAKLQGKSETLEKALQAIKTVCSWLVRLQIPWAEEV
ncbi:Zmym1 [Oopsacas minuta]|uniref:Zmym1 n=1 Tax=Oopsacas minuta TaxID=111878 RepID=A0AAV7K431_9METZ|nr:Zmym1 [Oopsacas minuta]